MILKDLISELAHSVNPVVRAVRADPASKVLFIGFRKGMELREHKSGLPSRLIVISGRLVYSCADRRVELCRYEELEIPVDERHAVLAVEDSLCLLVQG